MTQGFRQGLAGYGDAGFSLFLRRAFIKAMGFSDDALDRPIVGITDTASDFNPCHGTVPDLIAAVRRGVLLAGGLPMAFPTVSLHESFSHPTSMYLRNLMAIDTEEMIRAQPMDSVVLIGGCDKTLPAQLMGAASAGRPAIVVPTGPMSVGSYRGETLGACTDCRRLWAMHRAGRLTDAEIGAVEGRLAPTRGTCMVMGTASTVACMIESMGLCLPGGGTIPAVNADRLRLAEASGRLAVDLARSRGPTLADLITPASLRNAMVVLQAVGGSTNAVIHFTAIAGRLGLPFDPRLLDALGRDVPVLVDLKPSGTAYMEHFHAAGGVPRLLRELAAHLDGAAATVEGRTVADRIAAAEVFPQAVIRDVTDPVHAGGGLAVLGGSLAPGGALLKVSAASPALLRHEGRAVVFDGLADMAERLDDPALDVTPDDVLVLRGAGPLGAPGMPEAGALPIPRKLAAAGVRDMVRLSDARMSGTAFGTIVLHIVPEAAAGGPLALIRTGDRVRLDVEARRIDLLLDVAETARRRALRAPSATPSDRGYARLFREQMTQADQGCDFRDWRAAPAVPPARDPPSPRD